MTWRRPSASTAMVSALPPRASSARNLSTARLRSSTCKRVCALRSGRAPAWREMPALASEQRARPSFRLATTLARKKRWTRSWRRPNRPVPPLSSQRKPRSGAATLAISRIQTATYGRWHGTPRCCPKTSFECEQLAAAGLTKTLKRPVLALGPPAGFQPAGETSPAAPRAVFGAEGKIGAAARRPPDLEFAAVQLDGLAHDRQTETAALPRRGALLERLQQVRARLSG